MTNSKLLELVAKANRLVTDLNGLTELQRFAGRVARDPDDLDGGSYVFHARSESFLAEGLKTGTGLLLLHCEMVELSYLKWERLWNKTHPDRFGQGSDGEDFELMSVWRQEVRTLIEECGQGWMLEVAGAEQYIETLQEAGATIELADELAETLVDWLGEVRCV
jgi:hypothetical protein